MFKLKVIEKGVDVAVGLLGTALGQGVFEVCKNLVLDFKYLYITPREEKLAA